MGRKFRDMETPEQKFQREQAPQRAAAVRKEAASLRRQADAEVSQMVVGRYTDPDFPVATFEAAPNADALGRSARKRRKAAAELEAEAARLEAQANEKPKRRWW